MNEIAKRGEETEQKQSNKKQLALIILCWIVYIIAYTGRYGFAANINLIMSEYGVTKSDVGLATSLFFFSYGIGQIVNGIFSKKYNKKIIIPFALGISAILNIAIFCGIPFDYIKYLWLVNGFVQAILWPTLIETLSKNLNQKKLKLAIIFMSTTTALGTFVVYGLSAILVALNVYKLIFLLATILMTASGIVWFFCFGKCKTDAFEIECMEQTDAVNNDKNKKTKKALIVFVITMAVFAIFDNLIKDGLTTWAPTILKDVFSLSDSMSIFLTIILPILGTFGALIAVLINKKIKNYSLLVVFFYGLSILLLILALIFEKNKISWIVLVMLLGLTVLNMHAINNVITSMVPLYMRNEMNSGLLAGILNGFCYVGSTVSSYGLARIADKTSSWDNVFYVLIAGAVLCVILGVVEFIVSKIKKKK